MITRKWILLKFRNDLWFVPNDGQSGPERPFLITMSSIPLQMPRTTATFNVPLIVVRDPGASEDEHSESDGSLSEGDNTLNSILDGQLSAVLYRADAIINKVDGVTRGPDGRRQYTARVGHWGPDDLPPEDALRSLQATADLHPEIEHPSRAQVSFGQMVTTTTSVTTDLSDNYHNQLNY